MPQFSHLQGHGSYEIAFRHRATFEWLLSHRCLHCDPAAAVRGNAWVSLDDDARAENVVFCRRLLDPLDPRERELEAECLTGDTL